VYIAQSLIQSARKHKRYTFESEAEESKFLEEQRPYLKQERTPSNYNGRDLRRELEATRHARSESDCDYAKEIPSPTFS
jgi:hypothetical protein